jgi:hypothetical protein
MLEKPSTSRNRIVRSPAGTGAALTGSGLEPALFGSGTGPAMDLFGSGTGFDMFFVLGFSPYDFSVMIHLLEKIFSPGFFFACVT